MSLILTILIFSAYSCVALADESFPKVIAQAVGLSKSRVKNVIVEVLKHLKYHISKHHIVVSLMVLLKAIF